MNKMLDDSWNHISFTKHLLFARDENIRDQSAVCPLSGYYLFCWFVLSRLTDMLHLFGSSPRCPTLGCPRLLHLSPISHKSHALICFFEFSSACQCAGIMNRLKMTGLSRGFWVFRPEWATQCTDRCVPDSLNTGMQDAHRTQRARGRQYNI